METLEQLNEWLEREINIIEEHTRNRIWFLQKEIRLITSDKNRKIVELSLLASQMKEEIENAKATA